MYRLIISDLDGTLRPYDGQLSVATKDAAAQAMNAGCRFTLATGRVPQSVASFADELQVNAPLICCSGGLVINHRTREEWYRRPFPVDLVHEVMRFVIEQGLRFSVYLDDYATSLRKDGPGERFVESINGEKRRVITQPFAYLRRDPINCLVWLDRLEDRARVLPLLRARVGGAVRAIQTTPTLIECIPADVTKAHAASILARRLGICREEVMALGDNDNDVELLQWAGLSVAVGNASPATRAVAHHVVSGVTEDGAAQAILRFILS